MRILKAIKNRVIKVLLKDVPEYYYDRYSKKIDISTDVPGFSALAKQVISENRTYLREDRLYTLFQCVQQVPSDCVAMEIGVYRGGGSKFLAHLLRERGPGLLYVCDTFSGHAEVDASIDGDHKVNDGFSDVAVDDVREYLAEYKNVSFVVGDIVKTSSTIPSETINFIHLDIDVYPPTKFVLDYFWPKLARGGVIVGDDYGTTSCMGMKKAVDEFLQKTTDSFSMHLISGQVVIVKLSD